MPQRPYLHLVTSAPEPIDQPSACSRRQNKPWQLRQNMWWTSATTRYLDAPGRVIVPGPSFASLWDEFIPDKSH